MNKNTSKQRILIVGGGFGGIKAALELAKDTALSVTLVSDHSHFRYYPALYHAATGGKRAGSRIRLEHIFAGKKIAFVRATVKTLDRAGKHIITEDGQKLPYDKLIIALGNVTNYFGITGLDKYSFGIKSSEQAEAFKQHLRTQFIDNGCPDLNYVIVGGGPTGIELAGALPAYLRDLMRHHHVADCPIHVKLVEAAPALLPRMAPATSQAVFKRLQHLGIEVQTNATVKGQTADKLMIGDDALETRTVVWTAGVMNHPFFKANNFRLTERGKVEVDEFLQAEPDIFVIGDNANTQYSGLAQTALHDGLFVAKNIRRTAHGRAMQSYKPKKPITVIPVGKGWAAVEYGKWHLAGRLGWWLRRAADLIGFHDLESWPQATNQWLTEMGDEEHPPAENKPKN